ncbi:MAG: transferrin-binding protein-like solute binding protein [Cardiobacteriaceae bacterium]|nr:transferrin-binding protein-like solute binding protein [Cardiobacteriaceae bacterium]
MKKYLTLAMLAALTVGLTGCFGNGDDGEVMSPNNPTAPSDPSNSGSQTGGSTSGSSTGGSTGGSSSGGSSTGGSTGGSSSGGSSTGGSTGGSSSGGSSTGSVTGIAGTQLKLADKSVSALGKSDAITTIKFANGDDAHTFVYPTTLVAGTFMVMNSGTYNDKYDTLLWSGPRIMSYGRFGMLSAVGDDDVYLFQQGESTDVSAVPASGTVNYSGSAFVVQSNNPTGETTTDAKVALTADFDKKSITGTISNIEIDKKAMNNISLNGSISGNTFKGDTGNVVFDGGFYGPAAEEAAGVFADKGQNLAGGFGAKKE